uniref:DNA/RNA non-specific endonuclease domain-containing protein n=1 Tax=Plectus sambesii TaxID=2011161 RepID=A0A914VH13_9BILA
GIVVAQSKIADRSLDCKITVDSIDEELCDVPDAASTITTLRTPTALQSVVSKVTKVALYPFGNGDDHYFLSQQVGVYEDFANGAWKNMQELTLQYARHFGRLIVISGVIYDYDHDGLADGLDAIRILGSNMSNRNLSTHIYQIIIRCDAAWVKDNSCQNTTMANVLSFVLPNQPNDINCLPANDYLLQNTARVRDIELLTGLEFFSDRKIWPRDEAMRLRTHVNQELWQLVPTVKDQ